MLKVEFKYAIFLFIITVFMFSCPNPTSDTFSSNTDKGSGNEIEINDEDEKENESGNEEEIDNNSDGEEDTDGEEGQDYPEITGFSFNANPVKIRSSYAVRGTVVGTINDVTGGTPPFAYKLKNGNGPNDDGNQYFVIDGVNVNINKAKLSSGTYNIYLEVIDCNNKSYSKPFSITILPDPVTKEQEIRDINGISLEMRYIAPGTYSIMDFRYWDNDYLIIDITITTGYWMSETEITQDLFQSVMGYNPSMYNNNPAPGEIQGRRPVENISLIEAIVFCNRLSQLDGKEVVYKSSYIDNWLALPNGNINTIGIESLIEITSAGGYRIPSEYEWQWAAIGGDNSNGFRKYYSGGNGASVDGIEDYAWYYDNSDMITHEVKRKIPNEYGIYDMTGNVWEFIISDRGIGTSAFDTSLYTIPYKFHPILLHTYPQTEHNPVGLRLVSNR